MNKQIAQNQTALDNLSNNPNASGGIGLDEIDLNSIASGAIGGVNGLLGVVNAGQQLTNMYGDQSAYNTQMANMRTLSNQNYDTIGQLLSTPQFYVQKQTADDVRGMSKAQRTGAIGSTALSGASGGASIGSIFGPLGTAIGAGVGAIGGLVFGGIKDKQGQIDAEIEANYNNLQADNLAYAYDQNRNAALDRIQSRDNAEKTVRAVANGGKIERRQMGIKEFSDLVLSKRRGDSAYIPTRQKCNGGVLVRYKVK